MKTVVITGGTGLLGTRLSELLTEQGYTVRHLSRRANPNAKYPAYAWNIKTQTIDEKALEEADAIIHLAGAGIADQRWTTKRKKEIYDSRVLSTKLLANCIKKLQQKPKVFVACSAIGFYGAHGTQELTEKSPVGTGFMSDVCHQWEVSSNLVREQGIRTPIIRVGIVLSTKGGAMPKLTMTHFSRTGSYFGNGQQYYAWIHIDDIARLFIEAMENQQMAGIYNGTAPQPATNKDLGQALIQGRQKKMLLLPVPSFVPKLLMGEMANVVLNSTRAIPEATTATGFKFQYGDLTTAIKDLYQRKI